MEAALPLGGPRSPRRSSIEALADALDRSRAEELDEANRAHRAARATSLVVRWLGAWLRRTPRAVAEPLPDVGRGELGVSFAGHATVLLRYANLGIACDPVLASRLGFVRRAELPGLSAAELRDVDLVLVSSADRDHLHLPTLARLSRSATIVVPPRCAALVSHLGFARVVELGIGHSLQHRRVDIAATAVRRTTTARGACAYVIRGEGPSVFFCGQSGYFSGFEEIGRRYRPDIALLPIGGYLPASFRHDHMSPADALYAFEDLGARMLVPIRHGAFPLSYEDLDDPRQWLERLVSDRGLDDYVTVLPAGASRKFAR